MIIFKFRSKVIERIKRELIKFQNQFGRKISIGGQSYLNGFLVSETKAALAYALRYHLFRTMIIFSSSISNYTSLKLSCQHKTGRDKQNLFF